MKMEPPTLRLRFPAGEIPRWAARYAYAGDQHVECVIGPRSKKAGYFGKADFVALCRWKSPRIVPRCEENTEELVQEVTETALNARCEELRIKAPTLLRGVHWPVASVILHFAHHEQYPIIDFRALWSLGWGLDGQRNYNFEFWWGYVGFCRKTATDSGVSMRVLDRALWQYSKEHQK